MSALRASDVGLKGRYLVAFSPCPACGRGRWAHRGRAPRLCRSCVKRGAQNPAALLKEDEVTEIKDAGGDLLALADWYGVSLTTIKEIRGGRRWRHVDAPKEPDAPLHPLAAVPDEALLALKRKGLSDAAIARRYDVSPVTVARRLKRLGVEREPGPPARPLPRELALALAREKGLSVSAIATTLQVSDKRVRRLLRGNGVEPRKGRK